MKTIECPVCKGNGKIEKPNSVYTGKVIDNRIMAKLLKKEGYSLRQIMRFLGYKSPASIQHLLKKK